MGNLLMLYTYLYLREDGTPYYVGQGTRQRAFYGQHWVPIPEKDRILLEPHVSKEDAIEAEKFLIAYYGRINVGTGILRNLTDGGEGAIGHTVSEEARKKIGKANRVHQQGKLHPWAVPPSRTGTIPWNKGKPCSEKTKENIRKTLASRRRTP